LPAKRVPSPDRPSPQDVGETRRSQIVAKLPALILVLGLAAGLFSLALTLRCYVRCPFNDEWYVIDSIARGNGPTSLSWLFGQHNEHRIAIPRLLIWLDLVVFHGKNISLFVEIWLVLVLHWAAVCYAIERFTDFPKLLKRTLEGIFAFCIFHPNQHENLTWAFQVSFVLPFAIATAALLAVAFFPCLRRPWIAAAGVAVAPILAALNLAAGLTIGPVVLFFGVRKHLPRRYVLLILATFLLGSAAYLWRFVSPYDAHPVQYALSHPKGMFVYILTYFGASWTKILPHKERITAFLSLVAGAIIVIRSARRKQLSAFEQFCVAEAALMICVSAVTAAGRLPFGVGQAFASRYQTPAMLYWAALSSLVLIAIWRTRPAWFRAAQGVLAAIMCVSLLTFASTWQASVKRADSLGRACDMVVNGKYDRYAVRTLYAAGAGIEPAATVLRRAWGDR